MEKEIKLQKDGETINVTEVVTYSCDREELAARIRQIDAEKENLIRRSRDIKKRYEQIEDEERKLKEAFDKLEQAVLEEI